ncbi:MAG: hypothetical protein PHN88_02810 [Ignavibacteria bacterium]|nr:hypothetical protein [Ignavibacteria bacterium]
MIENIAKYDKPSSIPIITLSEAQVYLKNSDVSLTGLITSFINSVTNTFEDYLNSGLSAASYTGVYDSNLYIETKNYPILDVTKIYYRTNNNSWIEYDGNTMNNMIVSDYSISFQNYGCIFNATLPFYGFEKTIKIEYRAGWDVIPENIKLEAKKYVAYLFQKSPHGKGTENLSSLNIGTGGFSQSAQYLANPEKSWMAVLDNYKKPII